MDDKKYIIRKVKELANEWHNNLDDEVFLEIEVYLDTVVFPEMSGVEIAEIAEDEELIYYLAQEVLLELIDFENLIEQTINENDREPGREYFVDLVDEMIEVNWGPSVDGYWRNKIKNDSIRDLRKEKLNLDIDGNGKAYVDTTRNEVNDYLEVIADVVLKVKDKYNSIPKVNKKKKSWRAADERKAGLRENMNETFYLIISTLWNEWFGVTNGSLDYYALDGLAYADYAKEEAINHFIRLNRVPTEDEVIDFYINHEADLNQVITRNREIFDNLLDEADINLMEENELEVISFNREELVEYLKSYDLDAFTEDVVEEVARQLDENEDETLIGPDMKKLLEFEEGWIVGISAAKGEDIDIDYYNNHSLEEELTKLGLDFIGPNISMWDGSVEEGFLVNVHSDLNLERLYDLGNKYNQDWVAVWEAPLELGKTIIQVDFKENHTMLDGKAYSIVSDDISGYEATNLNEQTLEEELENKTLNEREGNKMSIKQRVISVLDEHPYLEKIREHVYTYYYYKTDYRDYLDLETIDNLITSAQSGDWTDAWYDLTSNFGGDSYIYEYTTKQVVEELEKVAPLTNEEFDEVRQLLWDLIQMDYSTYLDDEVPVYIMVDTGDGNYDFTLNPNYSFNWDEETAEDEPLELASLAWLAGTQGYALDQVLEAFREGGSDSKFLNSVVREGLENHTSMSAVTFLGTMRILDLLNAASGNGDVTINKNTYVGLFDTWSGSGSLFDIELEQDLVIPGNIINRIGTARGRGDNGYTPDQVYGFSGSVYDSEINLTEDLDTDVLGENKTLNENKLTEDAKTKLRDLVVEIEAYGQFYLEEDDWTIENVIYEIERMGLDVAAYVDRGPVRNHVEAILYIRGEVEKLLEFFDRYAANLYNENTVSILADANVIG